MHDLTPATAMVSRVVMDTRDDQLGAPTPCGKATVADLLDHIDGLCQAFSAAAAKETAIADQGPVADGSRLGPDWRSRIPDRLARLAAAWQAESAWIGMTRAGGVDMPAEVAARVAANEVLVHGWDLAAATGHDYTAAPELVDMAAAFVAPTASQHPDGVPGLFGPPVIVPDDAPPLDRLVGMTGRNPAWRGD
ncbi:MAG: TIGR03086 family protein [Actinobacteria bacterium]|nr:TIGR03086 family protein [Actinomycetota bacterium]